MGAVALLPSPPMVNGGEGNVKTVLVVDDDNDLLRIAKRSLGRQRRVITAATGTAAFELARQENVDLAIVDLFLAGQESGIGVIKRLKTDWPNMTIVMMSGLFTTPSSEAARRAGAAHCIEKGTSWEAILRLVEIDEEPSTSIEPPTFERVKRDYFARILMHQGGNVSKAARYLRVNRSTLQRNLRKL